MAPMTPEQQAAWMQQWRGAAVALAEVERAALAALTDDEALAESEMVLELFDDLGLEPEQRAWSGLVEQQALFQKLHKP